MARKKNIPSYDESMEELQGILHAVENENTGIDELGGMVKRAAELIKICRERLRQTESEIDDLFENEHE